MNPASRTTCGSALLICLQLMAALFGACQTTSPFPQPDATWETRVGQLQYLSGTRSVVGDCIVSRRGERDFQLDFQTGPGFPLMRLWLSNDRARAEGVIARGSWQGAVSSAPAHLRGWLEMAKKIPRNSGRRIAYRSPASGEQFVFALSK